MLSCPHLRVAVVCLWWCAMLVAIECFSASRRTGLLGTTVRCGSGLSDLFVLSHPATTITARAERGNACLCLLTGRCRGLETARRACPMRSAQSNFCLSGPLLLQ
eukprot:5595862-Alexandrium_andersonii.AAC.1